MFIVCGKEFGRDDLPTILESGDSQQGARSPRHPVGGLTRHLKQSKWKVPSSARTNCPVNDSPHFLQVRTWPLADLEPRGLDLFLSPLRLDSVSVSPALNAGDPGSRSDWLL